MESSGPRLVAFGDYTSPFCYLAERAWARLESEESVVVERRAFELWPPRAGPRRPERRDVAGEFARARPLALACGVALNMPAARPRTRKAHEAAQFAADAGAFGPMHAALYRAHFVEGRDIGRIDVLVAIGESAGLERTALRIALDIDRYTERVVADECEAAALGITAVPTLLLAGGRDGPEGCPRFERALVGLHDHDAICAWLREEESGDGCNDV